MNVAGWVYVALWICLLGAGISVRWNIAFRFSLAGRAFKDMSPRNGVRKQIDFLGDVEHTVCEYAKKAFLCFSKDLCV